MARPEVAGEACLLTGAGTPATGWCPISTVRTMRLRWLLPLCNLVIDVFLFAVVVHAVDAERGNMRHPLPLWHQVQGYVDPGLLQEGHVPEPLVAIFCGTAPAAIVAGLPLPNGWRASSPFDIRWPRSTWFLPRRSGTASVGGLKLVITRSSSDSQRFTFCCGWLRRQCR